MAVHHEIQFNKSQRYWSQYCPEQISKQKSSLDKDNKTSAVNTGS